MDFTYLFTFCECEEDCDMCIFNDEEDATYASVSEADKYDQEHFKEFNYLDR